MEIRRDTFGAAVRLAFVLSTMAALATVLIDSIGDVSPTLLASVVAGVGFAASWVITGRSATRSMATVRRHRVTVVPLRHPVG